MLIDAFIFNNELEVLDIRLHELAAVVDKFVIVEALEYHGSDRKKRANLRDNWELVAPYGDKIRYVCLEHLEPAFAPENSWRRENFHRIALWPHIVEASSSSLDVLMLSDADEIPRATAITYRRGQLMVFGQDMFYYGVTDCLNGEWHGTIIGTIEDFRNIGGLQAARNNRDGLPIIPNGGWHLSYWPGLANIRSKVANFAHSPDHCCKEFLARSDEEALKDIREGRDLFRRPQEQFSKRSPDDPRLPRYILENRQRFEHLWTT